MDNARIAHLHTYFLFPFSVNSDRMVRRNPDLWRGVAHWLDAFEQWMSTCPAETPLVRSLGRWKRDSYNRFDLNSKAYEDMVFFHPFVDHAGHGYRYDRDFIRKEMERQVYRRWAHEGTFYGFTSYSSVTFCLGKGDRGEHQLREGFLLHRMFYTRYFLTAVVALFYRATLLMFNEKTALVSKLLYYDQTRTNEMKRENVELALKLRAEFLHFSTYWFFDEMANKDEESEHFERQCGEYKIHKMMKEVEEELEAMSASTTEFFQARNTAAVNRLAMLSLIFGAGAIVTGFFGMNFGERFGAVFFQPGGETDRLVHWIAVGFVSVFALAALAFGLFVILANWRDYGNILAPRKKVPKMDIMMQSSLATTSEALLEAQQAEVEEAVEAERGETARADD